jgi:hypothetical protein
MDEKLLNRVRALLAKAESTEYPAEAEALTAKAHELMATYGIEQAHLAATGRIKDTIRTMRIDMTGSYTSEKTKLLAGIALACRCRTVRWSTARSSVVNYVDVVGHDTDLARVELLYTSLLLQASGQLHRQRPPTDIWGDPEVSVASYRRSWFIGFAHEVRTRLERIEARAAAQTTQTASTNGKSTELVLVDRKTAVDLAYNDLFGDLPKVKNRARLHPDAYYAGKTAGGRADLGQNRVSGGRAAIR